MESQDNQDNLAPNISDQGMAGLGQYLRSEREKQHITIEQVASATKISIKLLHALESDNYDELPAKPFVRGFVTSYARYLGLDSTDVLSRYEQYLSEKIGQRFKRPDNAPQHIFVESEKNIDRSKTVLSFVMAGFLIMAAFVFIVVKPSMKHRRHKHVEVAKTVSNKDIVTVVSPSAPQPKSVAETKDKSTEVKEKATAEVVAEQSEPKAEVAQAQPRQTASSPTTVVKEQTTAPAVKAEPKPDVVKKAAEELKKAPARPQGQAEPSETPASTGAAFNAPAVRSPTTGAVKWPTIPAGEVKEMLVVRAVEDSWIKYQADDFPVKQYTLHKGQKIYIRARNSIRFHSFKQKGVELSTDNITFKLQDKAQVVVLPTALEAQYRSSPFIAPNPQYLSTSAQ
ncbi:MAG: helix-turn-helix domain-containing protein [Bacteriovoracia bacterium]